MHAGKAIGASIDALDEGQEPLRHTAAPVEGAPIEWRLHRQYEEEAHLEKQQHQVDGYLRRLSGRRMSAFWAKGDFMPRLPAHPLGADAPTDPS